MVIKLTKEEHKFMSCQMMLEYLISNHKFMDNIPLVIKIGEYIKLFNSGNYSHEDEISFMNDVERVFYCDVYESREFSVDDLKFFSGMSTLLVGREYYRDLGYSDDEIDRFMNGLD